MRTTRALLACGVLGPVLFIAVFLVEGATRPGYSAWHNHVSLLATGDGGWMQVANFLVDGTLSVALAFGLLRVGHALTAVFIVLFGAGLLVSGLFVADPALGYPKDAPQVTTIHGVVHQGAGLATFTFISVAAFAAAARFARERASGWRRYSLATGLLVVVLFVVGTVAQVMDQRGVWPDAPVGLLQRIAVFIGWGWLALFSYRLWLRTGAKR